MHKLTQLLDLMYLINKAMLDHIRNRSYFPKEDDLATLHQIGKMALQLHAVSIATADALRRRKNGQAEVDEIVE